MPSYFTLDGLVLLGRMAGAVIPPPPPNAPPTAKVREVIAGYRPTRRFRAENQHASVTSLDFDDSGELALVARDDETLQIYNCKEGKHAKELKSQKYGAHLARFTHHAQSIIYASTKVDDTIRYLSSHDNSYIRYFRGHTDTVTSIALSPASDNFISSSLDNSVKIWALNSSSPQGQLNLQGPHLCAYDPSATVIVVASPPTQTLLLYDIRNYDKPPFALFQIQEHEQRFMPGSAGHTWAKLEFSNDGKSILVGTTGSGHFVFDAFDGSLKHFCVRPAGHSGRRAPGQPTGTGGVAGQGDVCFSPDGQFLVGGSGQDGLTVWDIHAPAGEDHMLKPKFEMAGPSRAAIVGYNHRHNLIVSGDKDLVFWLPDPDAMP